MAFPLYKFEIFSAKPLVKHFITTRQGGVGHGALGSLNLAYRAMANKEEVTQNRQLLADALHIDLEKLLIPNQTHSDNIQVVTRETTNEILIDTDALITNIPGICIAVLSADCVPILLFDQRNSVVAAVHSGWRGAVKKILQKTIEIMKKDFGSNSIDIIAGIGPSICANCYEIGGEVIGKIEEAFGKGTNLLRFSIIPGKAHLDLWQANKIQLLEAGIPENNIEIAGICTYEQDNLFYSARKDEQFGRFAAGIMIM